MGARGLSALHGSRRVRGPNHHLPFHLVADISTAEGNLRLPQLVALFIAIAMSLFRQTLLQKSFWGDERKFLEPLMRFTSGDVRGHIVSFKIDHGPP